MPKGPLVRGSVLCVFLFTTSTSFGALRRHRFSTDIGLFQTNVHERYSEPSLVRSSVGSLTSFLRMRWIWQWTPVLSFEPSILSTIPWRNGVDGTSQRYLIRHDWDFGWLWGKYLKFRLGPGLQWVLITSKEEGVVLKNGTTSSTFYVPGGNQSIYLLGFHLGVEIYLGKNYMFNLCSFLNSPFHRLRRRVDAAISLGVFL